MAAKGEETALGTARGRFIESLPRKAIELRGAIALLTATPAAEGPREDMRRRLHTLYASALVFRNDGLAQAVKEGIDRLDAARDDSRALSAEDLDLLTLLVKRLPELRGEETGSTIAPNAPVPGMSVSAPPATVGGVPVPSTAPAAPAPTPIAEVRNPSTAIGLQPVPGAAVSMSGRPPSEVRAPRTLLGIQPVPSTENSRREPTATGLGVPVPNPFAGPPQGGGMQQAPARTGDTRTRAANLRDGTRVPVLSRVLHVLVLSPTPVDTELSAAIATPSLTVSLVHTVRAALEAARGHAPDVIAADAQLAQAGVLVGSLRGDPLTDFLPVVLLESINQRLDIDEGRALGADDVITRPFHAPRLVRALGRVTGTLIEGGSQLSLPPTATLDELSSHVAEEIRRGIVEAAETGRDLKVPLGEGAEVLAAAWAAVARVRAFVTQQTAGKVRFSDRVLRAGASFLVLGQPDAAPRPEPEPGQEKPLLGRRILVVDDDTAVVWFFAGVLREEGATVLESTDGRDALAKARSERPDVLISDILMPGLDGFALCRELKRDPALADVPVILISWKEDLIARMRELSAGASGYLRKEAGAAQIVGATREVLKPRMELEAQLRASGEVRGNLEGTGVVPLLRSVRRARPDARITLRDAFNHFECELRDGRLSQLTRTASDGTFSRGERALPQLLGVSAGRFAVGDLPTLSRPPGVADIARNAFEGTLDEVLGRGARELGALLEALSPRYASRVARVVLDEDAYTSTLKHATEGVRKVVERLHRGESPQQLLGKDPGAASLLESLLMELARRGAIRGVVGSSGEDLVADARERRSREAPTQLGTPMSIIPPVPNPVISVLRPPATMSEATPELPSVLDPAAALDHVTAGSPAPHSAPPPAAAPTSSSSTGSFEPLAESPPLPPVSAVATASTEPPPPGPRPVVPAVEDELPTGQFDPVRKEKLEPLAGRELDRNTPVSTGESSAEASASEPPGEPELPDLPESVGPSPAPVAPRDSLSAEADILASDERRSKNTMAAWALALVVLIAIGFLIGRSGPDGGPAEVEAIGKRPSPSEVAKPGTAAQTAAAPAAVPSRGEPLPQGGAPVVPRDSGFEIYDGILDKTKGVAAEQALLIVESSPRLSGAELSVDGTKVGGLPAHVALGEGIHELAIARGDAVTYRFASVHRGKTWVLREP